MMKATTWVIGLGYLGSLLLRSLEDKGETVLGIDLNLQGDAAEPSLLQELKTVYGEPECIFCTQATSGGSEADYHHCYIDVVQAIEEAFPQSQIIFCSSCSVYGYSDGRVVNENSPCINKSARAAILLQAEKKVLQMGGIVARLAALYGPKRSVLLPRYLAGICPIGGDATRWLNYLHVRDAVQALISLKKASSGIYNLCSESLTNAQLITILTHLHPMKMALQAAPPSRRGASNQIVRSSQMKKLAWQPKHNLSSFLRHEYSQI